MNSALNERKIKMLDMKKNGATFEEIGKAFNISKQRVAQIIGGQIKSHFKEISPDACVYPYLRKWMNDNKITKAELTRRLYGNTCPNNQRFVRGILRGSNRGVNKTIIDKWLTVTGLTYEKLFERDESNSLIIECPISSIEVVESEETL